MKGPRAKHSKKHFEPANFHLVCRMSSSSTTGAISGTHMNGFASKHAFSWCVAGYTVLVLDRKTSH
jgi:hypothetical protein